MGKGVVTGGWQVIIFGEGVCTGVRVVVKSGVEACLVDVMLGDVG